MKILLFLATLFALPFQEVPYKDKEAFEIKLNYQFKQRPQTDKTAIHYDETYAEKERRTDTSLLPYLTVNVNLVNVPESETRVRISNNKDQSTFVKRVSSGSNLTLDFGFTDDMKDKISANEFVLTFLSTDRKPTSIIRISVEPDGSYVVNGEKRGRF